MTGTLAVISSAYLISRVWGLTGLVSFTMIENNKGPSTVPWGTPLLTLRRDVKDNFYLARKQLKDLTTRDLGYSEKNKIYLAESLTERNRILFKDCLKVKKDMEFKFIWTIRAVFTFLINWSY